MSRPLHALFTELLNDEAAQQAYAADPSGLLEGAGHAGLPNELVAEAIISFADTANPAVAEHLAPFVKTHGPIPDATEHGEATEPAALDGLDLMANAPAAGDGADRDEPTDLLDPAAATGTATLGEPASVVDDLDFGTGSDHTAAGPAGEADAAMELGAAPLDDGLAAPAPQHDAEPLVPEPVDEADEDGTGDDSPLE